MIQPEPAREIDPVEAEYAKNIWDVRKLPGVRYDPTKGCFTLNFEPIPEPYREFTKRFIKFRLTKTTYSECRYKLLHLRRFCCFFAVRYPEAHSFQHLSRADVEAYEVHIQTVPGASGKVWSMRQRRYSLFTMRTFLQYLQWIESPCAPEKDVYRLVWPEETFQPRKKNLENTVKYIPAIVLQQLQEHIHELSPVTVLIVTIMRATGYRISDVLNLRHDNCLEKTDSGWWLICDIRKTGIKSR